MSILTFSCSYGHHWECHNHHCECSCHPPVLDGNGYATVIDHILIVGEAGQWFLDGRDRHGNFTEACWSYDTWAQAMADVPEFIERLPLDYGVIIRWRTR